MKQYKLIVNGEGSFSISNETDAEIQIDYFPGLWGLKSQKSVLKYAKEYLANGAEITVTDYDNPRLHSIANKFIKELGLKQELFKELEAPKSVVTLQGVPQNLNQLKKFLTVGKKIKIVHAENPDRTRETEVIQTKNESVVTRKGETGQSHLYFGKPIEWTFSNTGATFNTVRDGIFTPCFTIEYIKS